MDGRLTEAESKLIPLSNQEEEELNVGDNIDIPKILSDPKVVENNLL
jgi:hypothetical protein